MFTPLGTRRRVFFDLSFVIVAGRLRPLTGLDSNVSRRLPTMAAETPLPVAIVGEDLNSAWGTTGAKVAMTSKTVFGSRTMTCCLAAFFAAGAALVEVSLVLSRTTPTNRATACGLIALLYPIAIALWFRGDRLSMRTMQALVAVAALLAGIATALCRDSATATPPLFFAWTVVIAATFFFSWQAAIGHVSIGTRTGDEVAWPARVPGLSRVDISLCLDELPCRVARRGDRSRPKSRSDRSMPPTSRTHRRATVRRVSCGAPGARCIRHRDPRQPRRRV